MALFSAFQISGSAMRAQSLRMNVTASNMANADSVAGPDGKPYRARHVVFQAQGANGMEGVGVTKVVEDTKTPLQMEYRPNDPAADENGYVTLSNVKPVHAMVNMIEASRSYQANVDVLKTSQQMMLKTLSIGEG